MYQSWQKLLFMHWQLPPEALRPFIPKDLEIDTYDGAAWIGVTPFVVRNARLALVPPIPFFSDFEEVNVRTYVHYHGVPGVWFFSLDASSALAVFGAWLAFHLPYFTARIRAREEGNQLCYQSRRLRHPSQPSELEASWRRGPALGAAQPGSLEFFLVERYCLYAVNGGRLFRARIHHPPWKLQRATLTALRSTMIEGQGLPQPAGEPLLHHSEVQDTAVWPIKRIN
jgi:uncharacterized protein